MTKCCSKSRQGKSLAMTMTKWFKQTMEQQEHKKDTTHIKHETLLEHLICEIYQNTSNLGKARLYKQTSRQSFLLFNISYLFYSVRRKIQ